MDNWNRYPLLHSMLENFPSLFSLFLLFPQHRDIVSSIVEVVLRQCFELKDCSSVSPAYT